MFWQLENNKKPSYQNGIRDCSQVCGLKKGDFLLGSPYSPKAGSDESCANNAVLKKEKQHAATAPDSFNLLKNAQYLYRKETM